MRKLTRLTPFDSDRSRAKLVSESATARSRGNRGQGMSAMVERFFQTGPFAASRRALSRITSAPSPTRIDSRIEGVPRLDGNMRTGAVPSDRGRRDGSPTTSSREIITPLPFASPLLDSGVFRAAQVARGEDEAEEAAVAANVERAWVTLVVYGWHSVDPGPLSWVFPSLDTAISAVRAMRNAVKWAIVAGEREVTHVDVDEERRSGQILLEK